MEPSCRTTVLAGWLWSSSKNNTAPALELLVFMSVALGPKPSFFMTPTSVRFHTLIFLIFLVCLKLSGK